MIEREIIAQKTKEYYLKKFIESKLDKVEISSIKLKKIPLGEKIIIDTNRPSLIVGSKGANIKELTKALKEQFNLENPQIEINEVKNIFLDAKLVADRIASSLEKFGSARFKGIGHKVMENVMKSGALGVEIVISGKVPSTRAKSWRFYLGYLKKCGYLSIEGVKKAQASALLKSGILGIKVSIMPANVKLPDKIEILETPRLIVEEITEDGKKVSSEKKEKGKTSARKKSVKSVKKKESTESAKLTEEASKIAEEISKLEVAEEKKEVAENQN